MKPAVPAGGEPHETDDIARAARDAADRQRGGGACRPGRRARPGAAQELHGLPCDRQAADGPGVSRHRRQVRGAWRCGRLPRAIDRERQRRRVGQRADARQYATDEHRSAHARAVGAVGTLNRIAARRPPSCAGRRKKAAL
ncbi:hypothetical protein F01_260265 [Burkholderia cenocepacia]|nr:hypothetical protein F01_260265 [Burkholderia cenocepacia]